MSRANRSSFLRRLRRSPFDRAGAFGRELRVKPAMSRSEAVQNEPPAKRPSSLVWAIAASPRSTPSQPLTSDFSGCGNSTLAKSYHKPSRQRRSQLALALPPRKGTASRPIERSRCLIPLALKFQERMRPSKAIEPALAKDALPLSIQFVAVSPL